MLLGEYEHTLDDKNRLTLPAKFRAAMEGGVVLTRGLDSCVEGYTGRGLARARRAKAWRGSNPFSRESRDAGALSTTRARSRPSPTSRAA